MTVYISMFVVILITGIIDYGFVVNKREKRATGALAFFAMGYIVFWAGMRNAFVDTPAYIERFNNAEIASFPDLDFKFGSGWGFTLLEFFFKRYISTNYHMWFMALAIISGICVGYIFYKYSKNFYYTMFLFVATTSFAWMMNGIRQFLACCILFACTPLIEKKKWFSYFLIVLLCSSIHASCILMIPIYFIAQSKAWSPQTILFLFLVLAVILFTSKFTNVLEVLLSDTTYSDAVEKFANDDGVNPIRVLVFSIIPALAYLGRRFYKPGKARAYDICTNMSIATAGLYAFGMVTSGILIGRLPIYTQLYQFILLPDLFDKIFEERSKKLMYFFATVAFLVYFYMMTQNYYYSSDLTGRL